MHCQFCYSQEKRRENFRLGFEDWIRFIDENHERINTINYGTGENTLDSDWFRLIAHIRKNFPAIRQSLTTNGYLAAAVEEDFCYRAFREAIDEVDVSLDFAESDKHNEFRGQPRAYEWALRTLDLCVKEGKATTLVFLGSAVNVNPQNIDGLFEIARERGIILRMNIYRPTLGNLSSKFIMSGGEIIAAMKYISSKYKILALNDVLFSTLLTKKTVKDPSGSRSIRIFADGSITPSTYLIKSKYVAANIRESNVLEKLENVPLLVPKLPADCRGCVYANECGGGVFDRRYLWCGTLDKKDPYCPQRFDTRLEPIIEITEQKFHSVHDGYLPTMFFAP